MKLQLMGLAVGGVAVAVMLTLIILRARERAQSEAHFKRVAEAWYAEQSEQ